MIYTELTKKAMQIAFEAHKDQVDKGAIPYIYHPIHLAELMDDEYSVCVALLHDTVEDTDMTFERLSDYGFPTDVIEALRLLTHKEDVLYMDYVKEIQRNPLAKKVKRADLAHNTQLSRLSSDCKADGYVLDRLKKYFKALILLNYREEYKDAEYFITENFRLVMIIRQTGKMYSISDHGIWKKIGDSYIKTVRECKADYIRLNFLYDEDKEEGR